MLVLGRCVNERIRLTLPGGDEIWIVVARVDRGKVRLGIDAPLYVPIEREEVIKRRKGEGEGADDAVG